jgi:FO synthase
VKVLERLVLGETLSDSHWLELADRPELLPELVALAAAKRDRHWGRQVTFSPKVFLPITNLCRNRCSYCSFRRSASDPGEWTMTPAEVESWLERGRERGATEALFCLGDKPESAFLSYRQSLEGFGHSSTVDYLKWAGAAALERGLLPHTNAGVLTREDMIELRPVNVSLGLMLENVSERLCEKGMPHHQAPDKRPVRRLKMLAEAGQLKIPFTTGILIGIGETPRERVASLLAIRDLHRKYGHIQEVIVQNFTARPLIPMASAAEARTDELVQSIALARLVLDAEVGVQAPPNLNGERISELLAAGINDVGGISPGVTPDYISPRHAWPELERLSAACARLGHSLAPRLPVYPRYLEAPDFVEPALLPAAERAAAGLARAFVFERASPVELRA